MTISVIVPALDEEAVLARTLVAAQAAEDVELIVVDGGSRDATAAIAHRHADRVLDAPRGRAQQMNAGARVAVGDVLLFVHADTRLPAGYAGIVRRALVRADIVGGRFDVQLDAPGAVFRLTERLINARSRMTGIATGDQAIFVRRAVFERIGGYPIVPLMEDIALSRALKRLGPTVPLRDRVVTSARRWERHGVLRTVLLMWCLRAAYYAGVSPARLARLYLDAR